MSEEKKEKVPKRLRIVYHKPEDYKPVFVDGIYGGITPRGELICNFFLEYKDIPVEEGIPLVEGVPQFDKASRVERIKHEPEEIVSMRDIRAALIIPVHQISSIANWMLDQLKKSGIVVEKEER